LDIEFTDNIGYGRGGSRPLFATFYRPKEVEKPLPLILWIHGGAWRFGTRHDDAALHQVIAQNGFACFSIQYRLTGEAIFPAAIQDCKCAVRYARAHADSLNINPEKIGAWGSSAGAHLSTMLGTSAGVAEFEGDGGWSDYSSAVQAVCDWYGPTDFSRMSAFPCDFDHDAPDSPESLLIGGAVQVHPELVRQANPITYISPNTPPMFIVHGKLDRIVPFNQSELLVEALKTQGTEVEFLPLENAVHGGAGFEADSEAARKSIEFFRRQFNK
jgi:acetyl esterase/lipase